MLLTSQFISRRWRHTEVNAAAEFYYCAAGQASSYPQEAATKQEMIRIGFSNKISKDVCTE